MANIFKWRDHRGLDHGFISIDKDKDGLTILQINVDDDFYAGTVDHKTLYELMTELHKVIKQKINGEVSGEH